MLQLIDLKYLELKLIMYFFYNFTILLFIFLVLICYNHQQILANQSKEVNKRSIVRTVIKGSGHPVPRFLSLKSNDVNMRKGPGKEYPIKFKYIKKGYPLKIVAEYHHWRKVIDHEKNTGWIRGTLLSGKRFALILDAFVKLRKKITKTQQ